MRATSVEEAFRPAFEEIARRRAVAAPPSDAPTYFEPGEQAGAPFALTGQSHVLCSVGTAVLAPQPVDPCAPALRVYGAFDTREDARDHADVVRASDPDCSLVVLRRDEWFMMPQSRRALEEPDYAARRRDEKLAAWRASQRAEAAAFDETVRNKTFAPANVEDTAEEAQDEEDGTADAMRSVYGRARRLRAGAEVRGQAAVALCVVPDADGECLVRVLGCFESTADADAWSRDVATRHVLDDDVLVAPTCEWLYPNARVVAGGRQHYRIDELQRIMDAAARNPEQVQSYKQWKAGQTDAASEFARIEEDVDAPRECGS
jgi:hypothetical protein